MTKHLPWIWWFKGGSLQELNGMFWVPGIEDCAHSSLAKLLLSYWRPPSYLPSHNSQTTWLQWGSRQSKCSPTRRAIPLPQKQIISISVWYLIDHIIYEETVQIPPAPTDQAAAHSVQELFTKVLQPPLDEDLDQSGKSRRKYKYTNTNTQIQIRKYTNPPLDEDLDQNGKSRRPRCPRYHWCWAGCQARDSWLRPCRLPCLETDSGIKTTLSISFNPGSRWQSNRWIYNWTGHIYFFEAKQQLIVFCLRQ